MKQAIVINELWVQKAQNGDTHAMSQLYEQFSKAMFNICVRMTNSIADAEDVLQESFVIAFKNLHQIKDEKRFAGWLKTIVVNECIRFCKKQIQWNEWKDMYYDIADAKDEFEWWKEVNIEVIDKAIKNLPNGCKQVFNLFVIENFTHTEIAQQLNISEGTSKSQYNRAKKLLKEKITAELQLNGQI